MHRSAPARQHRRQAEARALFARLHQCALGGDRHPLRRTQERHPLLLPLAEKLRHRHRQLPLSRRARPA
ncbi:hypothetical protein, partial [Mesorhizobium sp.]|uniref:hypothetical protein n=1 Tax=Mesorhizobium sp. TaxID=1871066 RepID=UPI00345725D7